LKIQVIEQWHCLDLGKPQGTIDKRDMKGTRASTGQNVSIPRESVRLLKWFLRVASKDCLHLKGFS
jgi:hypothetical protein